jgi:predicted enzyme related to lactoylglutathione lyase
MKITLHRIILFVRNVAQLKSFYQQHLHLTVSEETSGEWVVLQSGMMELALHKIGMEQREKTGQSENNCKIVFEVDVDLQELRTSLLQNGVKMRELKMFPGSQYIICDGEDPEGNVFQLKQKVK